MRKFNSPVLFIGVSFSRARIGANRALSVCLMYGIKWLGGGVKPIRSFGQYPRLATAND
jgi:hypothetical protein